MVEMDNPKANVIPLRLKSYEAKLQAVRVEGMELHIAGTLDGYIDFALIPDCSPSGTYILSCDEARRIIAALHAVIADIQANCLFDRDPLLVDPRT